MKSTLSLIGIALFLATFAGSAFAEMPHTRLARRVAPRNAVSFVVEVDENATEPRLVVPKGLARRAIQTNTVVTPTAPRHADSGAILFPVGGAFALAYAGAGFCLLSGRTVSRRLLLLLALVGAGGGAAWATPPAKPAPQRVGYPNGLPLDGVAVEFVDKGDAVHLIVPKARVAELAARLHGTEAR